MALVRIFGLIGYPVKHSLSPVMHNAAFRALKINAEYRLFQVPIEKLRDFFLFDNPVKDTNGEFIYRQDMGGFNVTLPHKESVLKYLHWLSPEVKFAQACNTIVIKEKNSLEGWNTDGIGFYQHLNNDLNFDISGCKVIIIGAGGAAKAISDQLARHKAKEIAIHDIVKEKSSKLASRLKTEFPQCITTSLDVLDYLDVKNTDLLINATPIGMKESDPLVINPQVLHSRLLVYDLIYNPAETKLIKEAKNRGAKVSNGLGMLLYQGVKSFNIWTDKEAPIDVMKTALADALRK
jgi:shikimate dehydrogenase